MNKKILACIIVATSPINYAEIGQCDLLPKLVHINGITTPRDDAIKSQFQLQQLAEEKVSSPVESILAYNRTNGFFSDIQQTFYQLKMQDPDTQDEKIAEALLGSIPPDMNMQVADAAKKYYQDKQEQAALAQLTINEQSEIIRDIKSNIQAGDKILLVPHSQGNLFANSTYTRLTSSEGVKAEDIKIFGVASPADRVLGNGAYVTSTSDVVIQSLAKIPFINVLPRNLNLPISGADPLGHGFKEIYLNDAMAGRNAVWAGIESQIGALNNKPIYNFGSKFNIYTLSPTPVVVFDQLMSFSLNNGSLLNKPVIFEPNGTKHTRGFDGYKYTHSTYGAIRESLENTYSFSNYMSCEQFNEEGDYIIGYEVSGSAPEYRLPLTLNSIVTIPGSSREFNNQYPSDPVIFDYLPSQFAVYPDTVSKIATIRVKKENGRTKLSFGD